MKYLIRAGIKILILGITAAGPVVFIIATAFCRLGTWIAVSDPLPARLDIVFTFGGERVRDNYSRKLIEKRYPEARWLISHSNGRIINARLKNTGMDMSRVLTVDTCSSTHSEIEFLMEWLREHRPLTPPKVGLVSGPYHMRRIFYDVRSEIRGRRPEAGGRKADFRFLPVPYEDYGQTKDDYVYWWRSGRMRFMLIFELKKMGYSLIRYWHR